MPRPIVLGNGRLFVGFDPRGTIRDLFWPQVGRFNHLSGYAVRLGVWVQGRFDWTDSEGWRIEQRYEPGTMVARTTFEHPGLAIRLDATDAVSRKLPMLIRKIEISSSDPSPREIRLFFTHDLRIAESDIGDTAFFNPFLDGVVHYKGPHWFLFGGSTPLGGLYEYATGIKGFGGLEGTWRDAEDGHLSMNPIAQGSVDSTFSLRLESKPKRPVVAQSWLIAGDDLEDVTRTYREFVDRGVDALLEDTRTYWSGWASTDAVGLDALPEKIQAHAKQSVIIVHTHIDAQGAVLAATDSDIMQTNRATYAYMWPRDGAFVSKVLDRLGHRQDSSRFFEFCRRILPHDRPVFMQKYGPDGSLGASWHPWVVDGKPEMPFQEDETALTVVALGEHLRRHDDPDFVFPLVDALAFPATDFMERHRDPTTGLPMPSWDLWEERRGIHTFTVATVAAAMRTASELAQLRGDETRAARYATAFEEIVSGLDRLFDESRGVFWRRLSPARRGQLEPDPVVDSSTLAVGLLGILPPDDPRVVANLAEVIDCLSVRSPVGGIARYEEDYYFRVSDAYPGNPWFICSLWVAHAQIMAAKCSDDLVEPLRWMEWAVRWSASSGAMSEQIHPDIGEPLSVSPLTWSHAEFVNTAIAYAERLRELDRA